MKDLLIGAVLFFGLGQAIMFFLNTQICQGTSQYVDGALFCTLSTLLAMVTIFKYWDCITAGDLDAFNLDEQKANVHLRFLG